MDEAAALEGRDEAHWMRNEAEGVVDCEQCPDCACHEEPPGDGERGAVLTPCPACGGKGYKERD